MRKLSHNIISLAATGALICMAAVSCLQEELVPEDVRTPYEFEYIGTPTDVTLELTVEGLTASVMTRGDGEVDDSEAERRVTDIWVFQYNEDGSYLVSNPQYLTIASDNQAILRNIPITLSDNNGEPCIVYVVTNTNDETWANTDANYTGFQTLDELKMQDIPNPDAIRLDSEADEVALAIPMGGDRGEDDDDELVISEGTVVRVPVKRMFAKLVMNLLLKEGDGLTSTLTNFTIDKIANTCSVATCLNEDGTWYHSSLTSFEVSRSITPTTDKIDTSVEGQTTYGTFVIYIPENIQDGSSKTDAIKVSPTLKVVLEGGTVIAPNPTYTAYPGSWTDKTYHTDGSQIDPEWDYTIQRNCVYYITFTINMEDPLVPSANSFIAHAGQTIAFYPYVRDEELTDEMSSDDDLLERYTFSTYLNPFDETGDKVISTVEIVWQTEDCIGDNSNYDLVTIDNVATDEVSGVIDERHRKIYVQVSNPGNALIAARNAEGTILWSWHIWVPNDEVDPEGQAIEYRRYDWDNSGIYPDSYVQGRTLMRLNLGALSNTPETEGVLDFDTYGMLYQWGRKDPFPPTQVDPDQPGQKVGLYVYNYGESNVTGLNSRAYHIYVGIHNNSNTYLAMSDNDGSITTKGTNFNPYDTKYSNYFDTNAPTGTLTGDFGATDNQVIMSTVQNPTTFVAAMDTRPNVDGLDQTINSYYNEGDWLPVDDDLLWGGGHPSQGKELHVYGASGSGAIHTSSSIEAYLEDDYGDEKTIFDPCPYGWRVSAGDIWLGLTNDGYNWDPGKGNASANWDQINVKETSPKTVGHQCGFTMYMQGWGADVGGETSFFPTQGTRIPSGQPYLAGGVCGNYHNATVDKEISLSSWSGAQIRRIDILHFHDENAANGTNTDETNDGEYAFIRLFTSELYYYCKAVAGPLRCVRDTK